MIGRFAMEIMITHINKEDAWKIRHQVMWPEKEFDYIKLADDDQGIHLGLFKDQQLISVISLFVANHTAQFRKFATIEEEQGKGYGSKLLAYSIQLLQNRGVKEIWCNARTNKLDYYKKFGLQETNTRYTKGGKSFVIMKKKL